MTDYLALEIEAPDGWFSQYDMAVLVPEVQKLEPGELYVELGVHLGRSFWCARKYANEDVRVVGFDLNDDPKIEGTTFYQMDSSQGAEKITTDVELIFIDANHDYDFVKADIEAWYPRMAKEGVMLFHDYDQTSPGVIQAVDEFAKSHNLKIETFESKTSIAKVQL